VRLQAWRTVQNWRVRQVSKKIRISRINTRFNCFGNFFQNLNIFNQLRLGKLNVYYRRTTHYRRSWILSDSKELRNFTEQNPSDPKHILSAGASLYDCNTEIVLRMLIYIRADLIYQNQISFILFAFILIAHKFVHCDIIYFILYM